MNLIAVLLGCGTLSLPWATAGASVLVAIGLNFLVLALNAGTCMILVVASERVQVFDLGALLQRLPGAWGRPARAFCDATIWVSMSLCLVGNLLVAADGLRPMLVNWAGADSGRPLSLVLSTAVVLPLCFLDQRRLAISSALGIAANLYVLIFVLALWAERGGAPSERCCFLGFGQGGVVMTSVLMQAVAIQMCVLPMYEDLEQRTPWRFAGCTVVSFGCIFVLFVGIGTFHYLIFGPNVSSNMLDDLPVTFRGDVARMAMAVSSLASFPVCLISMIAPLVHTEERARKHHRTFSIPSPPAASCPSSPQSPGSAGASPRSPLLQPRAAEEDCGKAAHGLRWPAVRPSSLATWLVVLCSGLGAACSPNLGVVNVLTGAISVAGLVAFAPALAGLYLLGLRGPAWRASMAVLIAFGAAASVAGLALTDRHVGRLESTCRWLASGTAGGDGL